ncbi:Hypothetical protein LOCK900_0673 [Lacticaseibacillus rhamnosus LOCK900]|nr:Hypothetical protein LOCK900_0673 [Lacticaseibacillus rhamnosus LOCK900]
MYEAQPQCQNPPITAKATYTPTSKHAGSRSQNTEPTEVKTTVGFQRYQ